MNIRVAICERDAKHREYVTATMKGLPHDMECVEFTNIYDLEEAFELNASAFDIVFLATTLLNRGDGVKLAEKIREYSLEVAIIFMSDSRDYYKEAFDVFAMSYLLKPVQFRELDCCFTFYTKNKKVERRASWMVKGKGGNWIRLFCRDLVYIESDNREIIIHMADGTSVASYAKLSDVVEQLPQENFIRCHQSYIVNMFFVSELKSSAFELEEGPIPISRKYQKNVKERYYHYMFSRM